MNRQPRALLSVLLIGVVAFFGWRWWNSTRPDQDGGAEIVFNEVATRGGTLTSSLRREPRTYNRIVDRNVTGELYSIMTGSKLVRFNRATQEVEAGLAEKWSVSPDNLVGRLFGATV